MLAAKKIAVLVESGFYEPEIWYYTFRLREAGVEMQLLSRLWGQPGITFTGNENHGNTLYCGKSFEDIGDAELDSFAAIIVPAGFVSDRLRYTENPDQPAPATAFLARAFARPGIVKGIICHGMWLVASKPELVRGRRVTTHNNLVGDVRNMGALYVNEDVVVDGDLVTGRTGQHCHLFMHTILGLLNKA
jgi:protease I